MSESPKNIVIGIDLGTTNSLIAFPKLGEKPEIIVNERGERLTPSVVTIQGDQILVGELAKSQAVLNHENTIVHIKRHMGTDFTRTIQCKVWTPEEISSEILKHLKQVAEHFLGQKIHDAVITVPAYFNDLQRQATMKAGELAGFNVRKLFNEPTAAALAYGLQRNNDDHLLVFDFGGGTLDITLLEVKDSAFLVKGVGGDTCLGGMDFDQTIVTYLTDSFQKLYGQDLVKDPVAMQQLINHAERAKLDLSFVKETKVVIPYITVTPKGPLHLNVSFSRETFDRLCEPIYSKVRHVLMETFEKTNIPLSWVKSVVMVGGTSRIPAIKQLIAEILPKNVVFRQDISPEEIVALGAGVLAGVMSDIYPEVDFRDLVSHDLGIEDDQGEFIPLIPRGTAYPVENFRVFTTTSDNQSTVTVHVLQRDDLHDDIVSLGRFMVDGLPEIPAGKPDIPVTFTIDSHGILRVKAEEEQSGIQKEIRLCLPINKVF